MSLCTNYYGRFSPGLTESDVAAILDSAEPCPTDGALGACVYPRDARGSFGAQSEQIYYANATGMALAAPTAQYEDLKDGDVCDFVGFWRTPYDGGPLGSIPSMVQRD